MIETIITSSLLIMVVMGIRFLFRTKISRRLQYMLWGLVLVRLLLPFPIIESPLSIMNVLSDINLGEKQISNLNESSLTTAEIPNVAINNTDIITGTKNLDHTSLSGNEDTNNQYAEKSVVIRISYIIWLIGSIVVGLWFIRTNIIFYQNLRRNRQVYNTLDYRLPVYISSDIASPCLFGMIHPVIYLTSKAAGDNETFTHVLTHELCHYRHGDHIWSALRGLCLAIYWWNPLVWAAAILSRNDSELACDEAVIKEIGEQNRLAYGHTLVDMIAVRKAPSGIVYAATTMVAGKRSIKERLNMIVKNPKTMIPAIIAALLIVAICIGCTFTGAKAVPLTAQEALEQLASSVVKTDNDISFRIPKDYKEPKQWNIHIAGRLEYDDGFSRSIHHFEEINDAKTWEPGKQYTIDMNDAYTELTMTAFLPGKNGEMIEKVINLLDGIDYPSAQVLYDLRNPYIGDASADSALLQAMDIYNQLGSFTIELETQAEPYILRLNFADEITDATMFNTAMNAYAMLLLALIDNASEIQWRYNYTDISTGGSGIFTGSLTTADATIALTGSDIKSYGQSVDKLQQLLDWFATANFGPVSYTLMKLESNGEAVSTRSLMSDEESELAGNIIANALAKSASWPALDITSLDQCYLLRTSYVGGNFSDYYAFLVDGHAVLQQNTERYSRLDDSLYEELVKLAEGSISTVGGADGPYSITAVNTDRSSLEACISEAIINYNADQYHSGDFAAEAHTIFKTVESGDTTTVYLMALYLKFAYSGGGFSQTGGSHMPAAITFTKNSAGAYELQEYWIPQDGAGYGPSIKEKFPADIYDEAIDTQKYILLHTQACYAQAVEYGNVDTDTVIEKLLNSIMSSPGESSNPGDYIDAHSIEYRELMYYGDYTLRYIYTEFLKGEQTNLRSHIMLSAMRDLLGGEDMGLETDTPQEWFDQWKKQTQTLLEKNDMDFMKNNYPKAYLLLQLLTKQFN